MKLSVIVTAFNRDAYIINAVESILCQKEAVNDLQIIVSKNFESKETDDFLKEMECKNILDNVNGIGARITNALNYADGDIIAFLQDDDYWLPGKIARIMKIFEEDEVDILRDERTNVDGYGFSTGNRCKGPKKDTLISKSLNWHNGLKELFKYCGKGLLSTLSVRASIMKEITPILKDIYYTIDDWIIYCSIDKGANLLIIPDILTCIRVHESASNFVENSSRSQLGMIKFLKQAIKDEVKMEENLDDNLLLKFVKSENAKNIILLEIYGSTKISPSFLFNTVKSFSTFLRTNHNFSNLVIVSIFFMNLLLPTFSTRVMLALKQNSLSRAFLITDRD